MSADLPRVRIAVPGDVKSLANQADANISTPRFPDGEWSLISLSVPGAEPNQRVHTTSPPQSSLPHLPHCAIDLHHERRTSSADRLLEAAPQVTDPSSKLTSRVSVPRVAFRRDGPTPLVGIKGNMRWIVERILGHRYLPRTVLGAGRARYRPV